MKLRIVIFGAAVISGCTGVNDAMRYDQTVHHMQMPDDNYRVFEHPDGNRIMLTPSTSATVSLGIKKGDMPLAGMGAAARKYLDDTSRGQCTITGSRLVLKPQYEFTFRC